MLTSIGETIYPIEIGISSHKLFDWNENGSYHKLIYPGKYQYQFKFAEKIHGIPSNSPLLCRDYRSICKELNAYLSGFKDKYIVFVSKEDSVKGDMLCVKKLYELGKMTMPSNIIFINHIMLYQLVEKIKKYKKVNETIALNEQLNYVYKRLHMAGCCEFHDTIDGAFHCALRDAKHTAMMLQIYLKKKLNVDIQNMKEDEIEDYEHITIPTYLVQCKLSECKVVFYDFAYYDQQKSCINEMMYYCTSFKKLSKFNNNSLRHFYFATEKKYSHHPSWKKSLELMNKQGGFDKTIASINEIISGNESNIVLVHVCYIFTLFIY